MTESVPLLSYPAPHVALLEFNRPQAANRIQPEDLAVMQAHLRECEARTDVHVLVLTGRGRHFSGGFDLRALGEAQSGLRPPDAAFEQLADAIEQSRLVTIAAINGAVIGGATDLAIACDLRIGVSTAQMRMPAARFGLQLYAGVLQRYVSRLGLNHAKRLVMTAACIDANEMLAIGFLSEIVRDEDLRSHALALASLIAEMPPAPLAAMKRVMNAAARRGQTG
jgi:enoyl-CoA hydratase/carnithine racemase